MLHDYLAHHTIGEHRRDPVPASLWDALIRYVAESDDRIRLAHAAYERSLYRIAVRLLTPAAGAGRNRDKELLGDLLEQAGHNEEANVWRCRASTLEDWDNDTTGYYGAFIEFSRVIRDVLLHMDSGLYPDAEDWRSWGAFEALRIVVRGLSDIAQARCENPEQHWDALPTSDFIDAMQVLARLGTLNEFDDEAKNWLRRAVKTGNTQPAAPQAMRDLARLWQSTGHSEHSHWLQHAADAGDLDAACESLDRAGRGHEAEQRLRHAVEGGNRYARGILHKRLHRAGRTEESERLRRIGIEPGGLTAEPW